MGSASASVTTTSLLALALAALAFVSRAAAQGNGCSSVMMTLAPCMDFISSKASEPGISCCSVLAGVVQTDPRCLCMVLDGTATSFGIAINQTRALELPGVWSQASLRHLHRRLPTSQQRQLRRKKPTQLQMPLQVLSCQMLHMPLATVFYLMQEMEPQAPQTQRMQRAYCFSSAHCCMPSNKW